MSFRNPTTYLRFLDAVDATVAQRVVAHWELATSLLLECGCSALCYYGPDGRPLCKCRLGRGGGAR